MGNSERKNIHDKGRYIVSGANVEYQINGEWYSVEEIERMQKEHLNMSSFYKNLLDKFSNESLRNYAEGESYLQGLIKLGEIRLEENARLREDNERLNTAVKQLSEDMNEKEF